MSYHLERPALGQKVALGTLYNAHTDRFQDISFFTAELPTGTVDTAQHQDTSTDLNHDDSYKGRLALLSIGPDFGSSLLSGLAPVGGAGACLDDQNKEIGSLLHMHYYAAFHHRMVTAEDLLYPKDPVLRDIVTASCFENREATHVVTKITWGCQTTIIARGKSEGNDDDLQAAGQDFFRVMTNFKNAVDGLQYMPNPDQGRLQLDGVSLDIAAYSEVFEENGMILKDLVEALDLIKLLPSILRHSSRNAGKGEQISYTLIPIQIVAGVWGISGEAMTNLRPYDNLLSNAHELLDAVLEQFNQVEFLYSNLVDYDRILAKHKPYVSTDHVEEVEVLMGNANVRIAEMKRAYSHLLEMGRMQGLDEPSMARLCDDLQDLASYCMRILGLAGEQHAKIKFAREAAAHGAIYVGHNGADLDELLRVSAVSKRDVYVFKLGQEAMMADDTGFDDNQAVLKDLLAQNPEKSTKPVVILLDCDALGLPLDRVKIAHYNPEGELVTEDLYEWQQFEASNSFAFWIPGAIESGDQIQKPVQRRKVKIPCPGAKCSNLHPCHWICSRCHSQIEFGYSDDYFYCDCGRAKFDKWWFKCNSASHEPLVAGRVGNKKKGHNNNIPEGYVAYKSSKSLMSTLHRLEQTDYINILILGETGVGKSTFINSLVNYLSFETLDEAKQAENLTWVIPCSFSIQTMDRSRPNGAIEERKIQIGGRDDEKDGSSGASATQQTAVYPVTVGTKTVRLIDTPGIGDTRGLAYDKKNMADILRTLNGYEQLHGILILLKSNNSRLTVTFNFCMQELLTHLHRSASKNMAFGFTNTRISNYSPGDTFGPLSALLKKHQDIGLALENQNTFCFDSESFRFLAAFKNDITMENEDDFRRSWDHSREEAVRLVEYFETKVPHQVKSTINLNGTRQLIAELTKPMAEISQLINTNIKLCSDRMDELRDTKLSGDKLRLRLLVPKVHLRTVKLNRPRTVCRNEKCVEFRDDGTGSVVRVYKNPCHNPCYLTNVEVDKVNCPELMSCAAFSGGNGFCRHQECGHSWQEHMHVYYELEEYTAMVTDTEAQRLFRKNESDITVKETALQDLECRIAEYKKEHAKVQESAARFGIFLKKHSITPYNDATLEYLEMLIQEEEIKERVSRDRAKLDALQEDKRFHIELVQTLESSMADDGSKGSGSDNNQQLDETGVDSLVKELYGLKHFGKTLQDVKDGIVSAHESTNRERPFKIAGRSSAGRHRQPKPSPSKAPQRRGGHDGVPVMYYDPGVYYGSYIYHAQGTYQAPGHYSNPNEYPPLPQTPPIYSAHNRHASPQNSNKSRGRSYAEKAAGAWQGLKRIWE